MMRLVPFGRRALCPSVSNYPRLRAPNESFPILYAPVAEAALPARIERARFYCALCEQESRPDYTNSFSDLLCPSLRRVAWSILNCARPTI